MLTAVHAFLSVGIGDGSRCYLLKLFSVHSLTILFQRSIAFALVFARANKSWTQVLRYDAQLIVHSIGSQR